MGHVSDIVFVVYRGALKLLRVEFRGLVVRECSASATCCYYCLRPLGHLEKDQNGNIEKRYQVDYCGCKKKADWASKL